MLKCCKCDEILSEDELDTVKSYLCHYGTTPVCEDKAVCPCCGGDEFVEVYECEACGEYAEELTDGVCAECLYDTSAEDCYKIAEAQDSARQIELNAFLAEVFKPKDIECILMSLISTVPDAVRSYVDRDREWFAEAYCKEVAV